MRTMSVSLVLVLLGPSAYAQFSASDPYCRLNAANPGCPPPIRVEIVPPQGRTMQPEGVSPGLQQILSTLERDYQARREQQGLDLEERRLTLLEEALRRLGPASQARPSAPPTPPPVTTDLEAQVVVFIKTYSDWEDYAPKMKEYVGKLRPGDTNVTEYLTLLYRLAKIDEQLRADEFVARYSSPLVVRVRAKYPGAYADTPNDDLEDAWLTKHPEYVDLASPRARTKLLAKHPEYAELAPPAPEPTPRAPTPEEITQGVAFTNAYADWEQYAPKMNAYRSKLAPGDTNATEYLTLLYRLAKIETK